MFCEICKQDFTDKEYADHLFDIKSKIICGKCHSSNIRTVVHNQIIHSECSECGEELI